MDKNVRIEKGYIRNRIVAYLFDIFSVVLSYLVLNLVIIYGVYNPFLSYQTIKNDINQTLVDYNLNYESGLDYEKYEAVIQDFYFNKFEDEIVKNYYELYKENYTIEHIYNVLVLGLSTTPTMDSYSTSYYKYIVNEDGTFDVDKIAIKVEGSGKTYEKNISDLFYTTYKKLPSYLKQYNKTFYELNLKKDRLDLTNRIISISLSSLIFIIVIPLTNKYSSTLFEKLFKIAHVNIKDGYLIKKWKVVVKNLIVYIIPIIGIILGTTYSIVILTIGFLFLNFIEMAFSKNNLDIGELILRCESVSITESLLFKNKNEENEYIKEHKEEIEAKDVSIFVK